MDFGSRLCQSGVILAGFVAAVILCVSSASAGQSEQTGPQIGERAPSLSLTGLQQAPDGLDASDLDFDQFEGKVVVLEFWATWCGPCVAAIPHLNKLADAFADEPVVFLSVTNEDGGWVEQFLEARQIEMRSWIGLDTKRETFSAYGIRGIPRTFVIDARGTLVMDTHPMVLTEATVRRVLDGDTEPVLAEAKRLAEQRAEGARRFAERRREARRGALREAEPEPSRTVELRPRDVLVLRADPAAGDRLEGAAASARAAEVGSRGGGHGSGPAGTSLRVRSQTPEEFRPTIQSLLGSLVLDETGIEYELAFELRFRPSTPEALDQALRDAAGLRLVSERRYFEVRIDEHGNEIDPPGSVGTDDRRARVVSRDTAFDPSDERRAKVVIRPTKRLHDSRTFASGGWISSDSMSAQRLLARLHDHDQSLVDIPIEIRGERYQVHIRAGRTGDLRTPESRQPLIAIAELALGVTTRIEEREVPVLVLRESADGTRNIDTVDQRTVGGSAQFGNMVPEAEDGSDRRMTLSGYPWPSFVRQVFGSIDMPLVDETPFANQRVALELQYRDGDVDHIRAALREQLGLELVEQRRTMPVLVAELIPEHRGARR